MKNHIYILLLCCFCSNLLWAQTWSPITAPASSGTIMDIDFIDDNNGAICRQNGADISYTNNGGLTWFNSTNVATDMYSVDMVSTSAIFTTGAGSTGNKTLNGGASWGGKAQPAASHAYGGIRMATASVGWEYVGNGNIYKTVNGAASWTLAANLGAQVTQVHGKVLDVNTAFWPKDKSVVRTLDGTTWENIYTAADYVLCMECINSNECWAGLFDGTIIKTTNASAATPTWTTHSTGSSIWVTDIDFVNSNQGWIVGSGGAIRYTNDGGLTWVNQPSGTTQTLFGLSMVSAYHGYASGVNGTLLEFRAPVPNPEIEISGNGTAITSGQTTISTLDDTDFGTVVECGNNIVTHTFTIQNTGTGALTISSITSSNPDFTISAAPTTVAASSSATFNVLFNPTTIGTINSTITVNNDDADEAVYTFSVQGVGGANPVTDIVRGNALDFDGVDDKVSFTTMPALPSWTIEAWIYMEANGGWKTIYASSTSFGVFMLNGQISFYSGGNRLVANTVTALNQWNHIAITYDGTNLNAYLNGVHDGNSTYVGGGFSVGTGFIAGQTMEFFDGKMDEVRIWNIVRTEQEIRENMHLTLNSCETGLAAYYQMNEAAGTILADKSGKGNDGTLTNGPTWVASTVNVGKDATPVSNSQTITAIPAGASTQTFVAANATLNFVQHSALEDYTITYQRFAPNATTGVTGFNIIQNPMWTVNKSSNSTTQVVDYAFTFPAATFTSLDPTKYSLYWRAMNADGNWTKIATANAVTATSAKFGKISLTGQFMVVQESDVLISDVRGSMYDLDGVNDCITLNSDNGFPAGAAARTVEGWIKTSGSTVGCCHYSFFDYGTYSSNQKFSIGVLNNGRPIVWAHFNDYSATTPVNDGQWHHIAVTYNGTTVSVYVDGRLDGSTNKTYNTVLNGTASIGLVGGTGAIFDGAVDEIRVWNVARTQAQIRENMHLTLKGNETGLVSYYQFNNDSPVGTAAGVKDAKGTNHGTTVNMAASAFLPSEVAVAGGTVDRVNVTAGGNYNFPNTGISMEFGGTTPNGELVVSRLQTEKPHGWSTVAGDVDNEYFVVRNFGTNQTFTVLNDLTFNRISYVSPADVGVPQASSPLHLYKRASNAYGAWGTTWGGADNASAGSNGMVSYNNVNNITSFSQIVIVNVAKNSGLPIELSNFDAKRINADNVRLDWATASELNNQGFEIERMLENETEFQKVAFVDGKGTTSEASYYQLFDNNSYTGVSYYRLKQVDFDGTVSYSEIRAVVGRANDNGFDVNVYPNPVKDHLTIRFGELSKNVSQATIRIFAIDGKLLHQFDNKIASFQQLTVDFVEQLPSAVYMISVELDNGEKMNTKFVKQK